MPERESDQYEPTEDEFEEFVGAALKVDPEGLDGKHSRECSGVLVVRGPTDEGTCELGEECAVNGVHGEALLYAHRNQAPSWITDPEP